MNFWEGKEGTEHISLLSVKRGKSAFEERQIEIEKSGSISHLSEMKVRRMTELPRVLNSQETT